MLRPRALLRSVASGALQTCWQWWWCGFFLSSSPWGRPDQMLPKVKASRGGEANQCIPLVGLRSSNYKRKRAVTFSVIETGSPHPHTPAPLPPRQLLPLAPASAAELDMETLRTAAPSPCVGQRLGKCWMERERERTNEQLQIRSQGCRRAHPSARVSLSVFFLRVSCTMWCGVGLLNFLLGSTSLSPR